MKKKITVFFKPIEIYVDIPDNITDDEIQEYINQEVFDRWETGIMQDAEISYWE